MWLKHEENLNGMEKVKEVQDVLGYKNLTLDELRNRLDVDIQDSKIRIEKLEKEKERLKNMTSPSVTELIANIEKYVSVQIENKDTNGFTIANITVNENVYLSDAQIEAIKFVYALQGVHRFIVKGRFESEILYFAY